MNIFPKPWLWIVMLLISPVVYFIKFTEYGFVKPEILCIFIIVLLLSFVVAMSYQQLGWIGKVLFMTFMLWLSVSFLPFVTSGWMLTLIWLLAFIASVLWLEKLPTAISYIGSFFIFGLILFPVGQPANYATRTSYANPNLNTALPPVIHIILDEHQGIASMPIDIPKSLLLREKLRRFYLRQGFDLYDNAYSHYGMTYNSIPNLVNFQHHGQDLFYFHKGLDKRDLQQNTYFENLSKKGYYLKIYQSNYLTYCHDKKVHYASCYTYPVHSLRTIEDADLNMNSRFSFFMKSFLMSSSVYIRIIVGYDHFIVNNALRFGWTLPQWPWYQDQVSAIAATTALTQLISDVQQGAHGIAFFAHVLLPHSPYLYQENCHINPIPNHWGANFNLGGPNNTPASRKHRYQQYEAQMSCAYEYLSILFDVLRQQGLYDQATIIIHGDHGSRINLTPPKKSFLSQLTPRDMLDVYQTLFAVKKPYRQQGSEYSQSALITNLLAQATQAITGNLPSIENNADYVYLMATEQMSGEKLSTVSWRMVNE